MGRSSDRDGSVSETSEGDCTLLVGTTRPYLSDLTAHLEPVLMLGHVELTVGALCDADVAQA